MFKLHIFRIPPSKGGRGIWGDKCIIQLKRQNAEKDREFSRIFLNLSLYTFIAHFTIQSPWPLYEKGES